MHPSALRILAAVKQATGAVGTDQIAERLGLTSAETERWLTELEAEGHVRRRARNGEVRGAMGTNGRRAAFPIDESSEPDASESPSLFEEEKPPFSDREAIIEASRCLECGTPDLAAPCMAACPTGIDVPRFVAQIAEGRPDEAAETIMSVNPLGGTCARVCPVEVLCEGACVLVEEGRGAIEIGRLQRYATDHAFGRVVPDELPTYGSFTYVEVGVAGPARPGGRVSDPK